MLNPSNSAVTTKPIEEPSGFGQFVADTAEWIGFGSARKEREFNSAEAQKQRNWEEYMSNTSYQRAVADMKKAGINPIMAFQQGGASTPGGSSGSSGSGNSAGANLIGTILTSAIKLLIAKK